LSLPGKVAFPLCPLYGKLVIASDDDEDDIDDEEEEDDGDE